MTAEWMEFAACKGMDPSLFFVESGALDPTAEAACRRCVVRAHCATFADQTKSAGGYWAGNRRNENGQQSRHYPTSTRQDALALWVAHRAVYASDSGCAQQIAKRVGVEDYRTVLAWARDAKLAETPTPSAKDPELRERAVAEYRRVRPDYAYDTPALDAVAERFKVSRHSVRNWTLQAEMAEKASAAL